MVEDIKRILIARHGREDFTVTPQQQMLDTLGTVLDVLTFAVAALGGISLLVGAVGMVTLMHIAVAERVAEIGLLTALGATRARIRTLFLMESTVLSTLGGLGGLRHRRRHRLAAEDHGERPAGQHAVGLRPRRAGGVGADRAGRRRRPRHARRPTQPGGCTADGVITTRSLRGASR